MTFAEHAKHYRDVVSNIPEADQNENASILKTLLSDEDGNLDIEELGGKLATAFDNVVLGTSVQPKSPTDFRTQLVSCVLDVVEDKLTASNVPLVKMLKVAYNKSEVAPALLSCLKGFTK